ncbi:FxSxx-COOH cyclophane-containing RiPP peptide [Streptosporangium sp. NPDC004379]|uniref:FxSxx-COOH cyclophane-containing RiPP peptide n=1 Tax=Streptosporangium sp. NPDC004379 TaxID=3366189 RepID=UPI0036CA79F0
MWDEDATRDSGLIDVSGLSLRDLDRLDETALAHALRRLMEIEERDADPVAGHQSSV